MKDDDVMAPEEAEEASMTWSPPTMASMGGWSPGAIGTGTISAVTGIVLVRPTLWRLPIRTDLIGRGEYFGKVWR